MVNNTLTTNHNDILINAEYIIYATTSDDYQTEKYPVIIKILPKISDNTYAYSRISRGTITEDHLNCMMCGTIQYGSHSEGIRTIASDIASHAEGFNTMAYGSYSHAEGIETLAIVLNPSA